MFLFICTWWNFDDDDDDDDDDGDDDNYDAPTTIRTLVHYDALMFLFICNWCTINFYDDDDDDDDDEDDDDDDECSHTNAWLLTSKAEGDVIAIRVIRLHNVNNSVWHCVLTDEDVLDGLHEHWVLVVHVCHRDADHRWAAVRHWVSIVSRHDCKVVRVINNTIIVQSSAMQQFNIGIKLYY